MHMVRHQTISRHFKLMASRVLPQLVHKILIEIYLEEVLAPFKTAERKEISSQSEVACYRKANLLAREGHNTCHEGTRVYTINKYSYSIIEIFAGRPPEGGRYKNLIPRPPTEINIKLRNRHLRRHPRKIRHIQPPRLPQIPPPAQIENHHPSQRAVRPDHPVPLPRILPLSPNPSPPR